MCVNENMSWPVSVICSKRRRSHKQRLFFTLTAAAAAAARQDMNFDPNSSFFFFFPPHHPGPPGQFSLMINMIFFFVLFQGKFQTSCLESDAQHTEHDSLQLYPFTPHPEQGFTICHIWHASNCLTVTRTIHLKKIFFLNNNIFVYLWHLQPLSCVLLLLLLLQSVCASDWEATHKRASQRRRQRRHHQTDKRTKSL